MESIIYNIVLDYLNDRVTDELKDEFINASLHFNINNDIYKKYSSVEIECMLNTISDSDVIDYVELCSVCGYILYRLIENSELKDEDRIESLKIILEISNDISGFLRGSFKENELYEKLVDITGRLGLTKNENSKIIELLNK